MKDMKFRAMHSALQGIVDLAKHHNGLQLKSRSGLDDNEDDDENNAIGFEELKAEQANDNADVGMDEQGLEGDEADNTADEVAPTEIHGHNEDDKTRLQNLRKKIVSSKSKNYGG